jgi:hypothetical protein
MNQERYTRKAYVLVISDPAQFAGRTMESTYLWFSADLALCLEYGMVLANGAASYNLASGGMPYKKKAFRLKLAHYSI